MASDERSNAANTSLRFLPSIPAKGAALRQSSQTRIEEAPYRALVGIVVDGRPPPQVHVRKGNRTRNQTGLTNRWRNAESLYGDLLGSRQALKAVNLPFNQPLIKDLSRTYPSMNQELLTCRDFSNIKKNNWSVMKVMKEGIAPREEDESLPNFEV